MTIQYPFLSSALVIETNEKEEFFNIRTVPVQSNLEIVSVATFHVILSSDAQINFMPANSDAASDYDYHERDALLFTLKHR